MESSLICKFVPYGREPILRRMPDGSLFCAFLTGGPTEPDNRNVVMATRSEDDGAHWKEPRVLFSHSERGCWATELFTGGERPMLVVMTYNACCHYRELQTFFSTTDDSGRTWTEPVSFPGGMNGVTLRQGITLQNGDWLFPLYWQEVVRSFDWAQGRDDREDSEAWPFRCGVAISRDGGRSYCRRGYMADEKRLWEPNCVETEPGHVIMLMRDNAGPYLRRCDSFDSGENWGECTVTDIPNPNTKLTLLRVRGKILLINNFRAEMGWNMRTNLEIRVSSDGLHSFERILPVMPAGEAWFYPHAFADEARETLYLAVENGQEHRLLRIPYRELGV